MYSVELRRYLTRAFEGLPFVRSRATNPDGATVKERSGALANCVGKSRRFSQFTITDGTSGLGGRFRFFGIVEIRRLDT